MIKNTQWGKDNLFNITYFIETERRMVVASSCGEGKMGKYRWKYINFHLEERISSETPVYSVVTIVNNVVLNTWKLLRGHLKYSCHTHTHTHELTMWSDSCVNYLDLGDHSTTYMDIKSSYCMLKYTNIFINCSSGKLKKNPGCDHLLCFLYISFTDLFLMIND